MSPVPVAVESWDDTALAEGQFTAEEYADFLAAESIILPSLDSP